MITSSIEQCRLCGNPHLEPICNLGEMALTGVFPKTISEPVPRGPLEVVKCYGNPNDSCGLVQLKHFFDPYVLFGESYGYRSSLNESMRNHLQRLAEDIRAFVALKEDDVIIDIGSNDGTLLSFFSKQNYLLFGIDPTAVKFKQYYPKDVSIIEDFFSKEKIKSQIGHKKAKVVTTVALFYDLNKPLQFLLDVEEILSDEGILVIEQSYLVSVIKNNAYDTICHEHAAYYGLKQIKWLMDKAGLKIIDCKLNGINGGSLRVVVAKKKSSYEEAKTEIARFITIEEKLGLDTIGPYQEFFRNILRHKLELRQSIDGFCQKGMILAGYGASTKGNVLLQFCAITSKEIPFMVEVNQDKWGRLCPGTNIPIISEKEAKNKKIDVFLVLPWHFKESVILREKDFIRQGGTFLFPFPIIHT
ncbi:MAG: class I SAM-dependent methyltransferase, partial [Candidatus Omnitrophota bacterium]